MKRFFVLSILLLTAYFLPATNISRESASNSIISVNEANASANTSNAATTPEYPRWSKRGLYLSNACGVIDSPDSTSIFVNYCKQNNITYVLIDGVAWYGGPCQTFSLDSSHVDAPNATLLQNFIYALKTQGNVEQVGVIVYQNSSNGRDSNSYSVKVFDVNNLSKSINKYNTGLPWTRKVDVLSIDEEFWHTGSGYQAALDDFHKVHMQMLRDAYRAAHQTNLGDSCPHNYLMVEDYVAPALNPDTLSKNWTQTMEIDSICHYADRILLSSYTYYANTLWNRSDWEAGYVAIGSDSINGHRNNYYKKEVWPVFSAENYNDGSGPYLYGGVGDNFSGAWMRVNSVTPDSLEQIYYDSLRFSMENHVWTPDNLNHPVPMHGDTCFKIQGSMWFNYKCIAPFTFNTSTTTGAIRFLVNLGHDTLWHGGEIVLNAKVSGGTGPYSYAWYDEDRNHALVQAPSSNSTFAATTPDRYVVVVTDSKNRAATDYVNVFENCINTAAPSPTAINTIKDSSVGLRMFPNPANSILNIDMVGEGSQKYYALMYDVSGREIMNQELQNNNGKNVLNISNFPVGVYMCKIIDKEGKLIKTNKIMIMR